MVASSRTLLGLLCLGLRLQTVAATCYFPDGTTANDTPCFNNNKEDSACCGSGYACYGSSAQYYLCMATGDELQKAGASKFVRGSCTDKTWRSGNCPSVCVDEDRDNVGGGNGVGQCPDTDTEFYCISTGLGEDNCTTGYDIIDFVGTLTALTTIGVAESTSSSSSSSTTSSTTTTTSSASTTTTGTTSTTGTTGTAATATSTSINNDSSGSSSGGSKTAIGVGVGVGVAGGLAVLGGIFYWYMRNRNKKRADAEAAASAAGFLGGGGGSPSFNMDKAPTGYAPTPNLGTPPAGYYAPSDTSGTVVPPASTSPYPPAELYDSPTGYKGSPAPQQQFSEMPSTQAVARYEMA